MLAEAVSYILLRRFTSIGVDYMYLRMVRLEIPLYALQRTPNSEETLLWRGWGKYRAGDTNAAISDFQAALAEHPYYEDAKYALDYVMANP